MESWSSPGQHVRACTHTSAHPCIGQGASITFVSTHERKALLERSHTHTHARQAHEAPSTRAHSILSDARSPSSDSESLIHSLSTRSKKFLYEHMLAKLLSCRGRERGRGA